MANICVLVIELGKISDCGKEISAQVGNSVMADFKIVRIIPLRREIASTIHFYLDPGEVFAVLPYDIASQERAVEHNAVGLFRELFLQKSTQ
jgi:hypothetical protein